MSMSQLLVKFPFSFLSPRIENCLLSKTFIYAAVKEQIFVAWGEFQSMSSLALHI
uniref:Uncharacterized protein n=1 Tax=Manihot esculenta TaxID=3983 RepID=A0A2C9W0Y8_MANES